MVEWFTPLNLRDILGNLYKLNEDPMVRLWPHFTKSHSERSASDRHVVSANNLNLKLQIIISRSEIEDAYVLAYT